MIRLHHCAESRSMRTLWLLYELGLEPELVRHPFGANLRAPEFLALNPAGRVPALEFEGQTLWETGAITEVLCERFPEPGMGRAPGDPERAEWLIMVHFAETISQHCAILTQHHIVLFEDHMRSPTVTKLEARRLAKCYDVLEARLAEGQDYLLASGFSAADVSIGQALYMARHFTTLEGHPLLAAWWERVTARPAYQASLPLESEAKLYAQDFYPPLAERHG